MTCEVFVQMPQAASPESHASPSFFIVFAALMLTLVALKHTFYLKQRRSRVSPSTNDPTGREPGELPHEDVDRLNPEVPLAIFLVGGDHALAPTSIRIFGNLYAKEYPQILFVSVGVLDYAVLDAGSEGKGTFNGNEEAKRLKRLTRLALDPYLAGAHKLDLKADCRVSVATNPVDEIDKISDEIAVLYPRAVFFVSKLVFQKPRWYHRLLHSGTSDSIRKRLEKKGFPVTILPVVLPA